MRRLDFQDRRFRDIVGDSADDAKTAFMTAVAAVDPTKRVKSAVRQGLLDDWFGSREAPKPIHVLALGKAAPRMVWGLVESNVPFSGIGVAPKGVPFPQCLAFEWHAGDHPVVGSQSLAAGRAVEAWLGKLPPQATVLLLLSGGASACCDIPHTTEEKLLAEARSTPVGLSIDELAVRRAEASGFKQGRLGEMLSAAGADVRVWLMQDTPSPELVGGQPVLLDDVQHVVLATPRDAVAAAGSTLASAGWQCFEGEMIDGEVAQAVQKFCTMAQTLPPGSALIAGGETTCPVPDGAPRGGRNQHAAALVAGWLDQYGSGATFMAAGTDGVDGTTREAGAVVTRANHEAAAAAPRFDTHAVLEAQNATLRSGATGTNVADLWVMLLP